MKEIKKYLPLNWKEKAKETGALIRGRNIKTAEELLALNMLYITNESSFQMTSSAMRLSKGISINKNAVYKRIKSSGEWMRAMAEELCAMQGSTVEKPAFLKEKQVKLIDASDETTKGKNKNTWRLHYVFNLFDFKCADIKLSTNEEEEQLKRHKIDKNDIVIGDRAYCTVKGIEHVLDSNGDFVLRYRSKAFTFYDNKGNVLDVLPILRSLKPLKNTDICCYYKLPSGQLRPLRIVAMKKDAKAIELCKRKMARDAVRLQRKPALPETAELNKYVVLVTSLKYTNEQILELYRARWQIEQVFFRLKSLFGYGHVPSKNEETVKSWFYGKLFLAALCERILKTSSFSPEVEFFIVDIITAKLVE